MRDRSKFGWATVLGGENDQMLPPTRGFKSKSDVRHD